jgi:hypothetical protein
MVAGGTGTVGTAAVETAAAGTAAVETAAAGTGTVGTAAVGTAAAGTGTVGTAAAGTGTAAGALRAVHPAPPQVATGGGFGIRRLFPWWANRTASIVRARQWPGYWMT